LRTALAARGTAEFARRNPSRATEGSNEVGNVAETHIVGDVGDRTVFGRKRPGRAAKTGAHEILVRRYAEHDANTRRKWQALASFRPSRFEVDGVWYPVWLRQGADVVLY
jgi:hypothetical protein